MASVQENVTVTDPAHQPLALGWLDGVAVAMGCVVSMLMPLRVLEAVLPARSVQEAEADWPAPLCESICDTVEVTGPETESTHDHVTVTAVLFQPLPLGGGVMLRNCTMGGVRSMLMGP
jgi:hypothetical protein